MRRATVGHIIDAANSVETARRELRRVPVTGDFAFDVRLAIALEHLDSAAPALNVLVDRADRMVER